MEQITRLLKLIGLPLMALSGVIYALLKQNQGLKRELNNERAGRAVDQIKREIEEEKQGADAAEAAYRAARDEFRNGGGGE
jgi:hypothetical protein